MYIDFIEDKIVMELDEFDIEKTQIELGDNIEIDLLKIPLKYKKSEINLLLHKIIEKVKGQIEYVD